MFIELAAFKFSFFFFFHDVATCAERVYPTNIYVEGLNGHLHDIDIDQCQTFANNYNCTELRINKTANRLPIEWKGYGKIIFYFSHVKINRIQITFNIQDVTAHGLPHINVMFETAAYNFEHREYMNHEIQIHNDSSSITMDEKNVTQIQMTFNATLHFLLTTAEFYHCGAGEL